MSKKLTDEELFAQFEGIDAAESTSSKPSPSTTTKQPPPNPDDLFQELGIAKPTSRPHTPKPTSTSTTPALRSSPKRTSTATPPSSDAARSSEERGQTRKSGESTRSFHNSFTPKTENEGEVEQSEPEKGTATAPAAQAQSSGGGGGWWGGIFGAASAAVKQAEALAKEIQKTEEAQRWAEQVKGNVGALRGLGGELRSRALPTFSSLLHTLAPPISSHERLQIHTTHDIHNYPSLDPLIYNTFSRVMSQVEGGDLIVLQRGQESSPRRSSDSARGYTGSTSSGWSDGPWWRDGSQRRSIGAVRGIVEGTKLARASAESYAVEYYDKQGGLEEAAKRATEVLSETNPTRSSDIFLAFQAITHTTADSLFSASKAENQESQETGIVEPASEPEDLLSFAIYLHDPIHGITYSTVTQPIPAKWIEWLDATGATGEAAGSLPEEIADIITTGGVDPREWVAEWVEEILALGVGIVAQRYIARRMGVGVGGLGRGKGRQEAVESGGGEAARAI